MTEFAVNLENINFDSIKTNNLEAIVLAPSGGGKSYLVRSLDKTVLYLYGSDEAHGKISASGGKAEIKALNWSVAPDTGKELNADESLQLIDGLLSEAFLDHYGIGAVVIDSMTSLEKTIKASAKFRSMCLTKDGGHNQFAEGEKCQILIDGILSKVRNLASTRELDLVVTCIVDVRDRDEKTGAYKAVKPRLSSYGVAETTLQQFSQVLLLGKVNLKGRSGHCFQFDPVLERVSKDENGEVKKYLNFEPRVIGSSRDLNPYEPADLEKIRDLIKE